MSGRKISLIKAAARGLPLFRGSERRGTLFVTEVDDEEILVEEVDVATGRIIERSRMSRQAYTDAQALSVYRKTRNRSRWEEE